MKAVQFVICVLPFLMGGCAGESDKATSVESKKEGVLEYQIESLEQAKEVEALLQNSADKLRKEIDEQIN